jgi:sulfur-carrier protein
VTIVIVRIPATLSQDGKVGMIDLTVTGAANLQSVLDQLEARVPGATKKILDSRGLPHRYVNLYVNGDDVRYRSGMNTPVNDNDEVLILPAISGG